MQISQSQINQQSFGGKVATKQIVENINDLNLGKVLNHVNKGDTFTLVLKNKDVKNTFKYDNLSFIGKILLKFADRLSSFGEGKLPIAKDVMISNFKKGNYDEAMKNADLIMRVKNVFCQVKQMVK